MKRLKKLMVLSMLAMFVFVICGVQLVHVSANGSDGGGGLDGGGGGDSGGGDSGGGGDGGKGKPRTHNKNMAFELGYFKPNLNFNARYTSDATQTDNINFKDELGLSNKHMMEYRLWINKNLRIAYANVRYAGNRDLTSEISYGDSKFDVGTNVSSNLGIDYYRLTWLRPLGKTKKFTTNWLVDIKGFKFDTKLAGNDSNLGGQFIEVQKGFSGAIPALGLRLESKLPTSTGFGYYGEISGLPLGRYGHLYDIELGGKYYINENFTVSLAYRIFDLSIKSNNDNDDRAQLKQSGPYFEIAYRF